jgi:hypothetical protein
MGPKSLRLTRGHRFGFRLWRFLYEFINSATDKRQAHRHTIGRIFRGSLHAPSAILCELSETKVPGEPLMFEEENGWRPYLPIVDEVISSLDEGFRSQELEIFTAEGVTSVIPPRSLFARLRARIILNRDFSHYARLRNWHEGRGRNPTSFVEALAKLGIVVEFRAFDEADGEISADPSVARFFESTP